jgi:hypothetical protein
MLFGVSPVLAEQARETESVDFKYRISIRFAARQTGLDTAQNAYSTLGCYLSNSSKMARALGASALPPIFFINCPTNQPIKPTLPDL